MIRTFGFLLMLLTLALCLSSLHPLRLVKNVMVRSKYNASASGDSKRELLSEPKHLDNGFGGSHVGYGISWPSLPRKGGPKLDSSAVPSARDVTGVAIPESGPVLPPVPKRLYKDSRGVVTEDIFQPAFPVIRP